MSLEIEASKVKEVLLADGWHRVDAGTFDLDAYEFVKDEVSLLDGGSCVQVPSVGAIWTEGGVRTVACPLISILAVSY